MNSSNSRTPSSHYFPLPTPNSQLNSLPHHPQEDSGLEQAPRGEYTRLILLPPEQGGLYQLQQCPQWPLWTQLPTRT